MSDQKSGWSILAQGESGEIVLAVDFPATGRLQADFDELASRLTAGHGFWRTAVAPTGLLTGVSPEEYIQPWLDEVRRNGAPVRAVAGFCVGSVYAALLAERIGQWQERTPDIILFDPELVNGGTIYWQFAMVVESLSQMLDQEGADQLREAGRVAYEEIEEPDRLAAALVGRFREAIAVACERTGLGEEFVQELVDMFGSFMSYLSIADQADVLPLWSTATALQSSGVDNGLNRVRNSILKTDDRLVAEEIVFSGVEHADLLRSDEVAKAATELLTK